MIELAAPWALVALLLPVFIWFLCPHTTLHLAVALKVPFFDALHQHVSPNRSFAQRSQSLLWLFISWSLLVIALAGPRWVGPPQPLAHEGYNIMLALDISPSMGINDMMMNHRRNTRLEVVKRAARQFVENRVGDNIGLILFGEQAYLFTPLTYDKKTVLMRLDDASVGLAGKSTSLGDALGLAIKRLQKVPKNGRMIILLTDGVSNTGVLSPIKAAELAHQENMTVYTIGLHAEMDPQSFSSMFLNSNGGADLDEKTLQTVANITGGRYFRASNLQSLQQIYQEINKMAPVSQKKAAIRPQHDYTPWFLAAGLGLLLITLAYQSGLLIGLQPFRTREDRHVA